MARTESVTSEADFETLYRAHCRSVLAYCTRRSSSLHDAWDAAAEVFVVAWRRIDQIPDGNPEAWLIGVARKVLANQRRSAGRFRRVGQLKAGDGRGTPAVDEILVRNQEATDVLTALAGLRPLDREVIQLVLWEEISHEDVATILGISRAAVDQRLSRAKRRLARQFQTPSAGSGNATPTAQEGGVS